jgi:formate hydrogenlyase transcriptional activator
MRPEKAMHASRIRTEVTPQNGFEHVVGESAALRRVLRYVEIVAPTDATVLVLGETGTGKELVARAIHDRSNRCDRPFVKVNCAAIPSGLLESELFGHERGAFTGAVAQKVGRFEMADGGTLLLDEVGEIPLELQPKLLRVLQEQEFERLGGTRTIRVDVRVVAATNRHLDEMVEAQHFRDDLYYRLNVFPIAVPPLRERPEDVDTLVRHFVDRFARQMGVQALLLLRRSTGAVRDRRQVPQPPECRDRQHVLGAAPAPVAPRPAGYVHPGFLPEVEEVL